MRLEILRPIIIMETKSLMKIKYPKHLKTKKNYEILF